MVSIDGLSITAILNCGSSLHIGVIQPNNNVPQHQLQKFLPYQSTQFESGKIKNSWAEGEIKLFCSVMAVTRFTQK